MNILCFFKDFSVIPACRGEFLSADPIVRNGKTMDYQKKGDISADNSPLILISVVFLLLVNKKIIYTTYSDYIILVVPCQGMSGHRYTRITRMKTFRKVDYHDPDKEK